MKVEYPVAFKAMTPENPFLRFKTRGLVLWALSAIIPTLILLSILKAFVPSDQKLTENLTTMLWHLWIALWVYRKIQRHNLDARQFFRETGQIGLSRLSGLAVVLLVWSVGETMVRNYAVLNMWPGLLDWVAELHPHSPSTGSIRALNMVLETVIFVVLAPLIEETLFRGLLLNRWAAKWGVRKAIVISASAFAILHTDLLGAFVFGVCVGLLYLRTHTLRAPIILHALNNSMVIAIMFVGGVSDSASYNTASHQSFPWFGIACVVLASPFVIAFIYKNWPSRSAAIPYHAEDPTGTLAQLPDAGSV